MNVNDKVSMEYEARVMIDEKTYHLFKEAKIKESLSYHYIKNENIYFDNDDLYLTHHHMVLRIRTIDDKNHELTLKIKGENGDIEITSPLGEKENKLSKEYLEYCKNYLIKKEKILLNEEFLSNLVFSKTTPN